MEFEMTGMEAVAAKLRGLGQEMSASGARRAVIAGGRVIQAAMIETAPVLDKKTANSTSLEPGALKANIRLYLPKDEVPVTAIIGPGAKTAHVARWVEYGHRMVTGGSSVVLSGGRSRGGGTASAVDVPEHPFLRPAFESSVTAAQEAMVASVGETIQKATTGKAA
jgi:HK97 gp10 family phage protein